MNYSPPSVYFPGIIYNEAFYNNQQNLTSTAASNLYLLRIGTAISQATSTTFQGTVSILNSLTAGASQLSSLVVSGLSQLSSLIVSGNSQLNTVQSQNLASSDLALNDITTNSIICNNIQASNLLISNPIIFNVANTQLKILSSTPSIYLQVKVGSQLVLIPCYSS